MPDCSSITCCPDGSYGYQIPSDNPDIPVIPSYTLSLTVDPLGYGAVTGEGDYPQSTFAQIQAYPDEGKYFVNWTGDYSGTENPANIFMDGNKSIQANFAASQLSLQLFNDPEEGGTTTGQGVYAYGDTANIEATAASGYEFSGWTGGVTTSDNPHDFIITENTQITANYTQLEFELELSVSPADSGFVSGDGSYASGATALISAVPSSGFCFAYWEGDASGYDPDQSIVMTGNKSATAVFSELFSFSYTFLDDSSKIFYQTVNAVSPIVFHWEFGNPTDSTTQFIIYDQDDNVLYSTAGYVNEGKSGTIDAGYTITGLKIQVDVYGHATNPEERYVTITSSCPT